MGRSVTITWGEDEDGRGELVAREDLHDEKPMPIIARVPWAEPISTANTDADAVANAVAQSLGLFVEDVEHDGEYIHATFQ